jgi:hypothetical protein
VAHPVERLTRGNGVDPFAQTGRTFELHDAIGWGPALRQPQGTVRRLRPPTGRRASADVPISEATFTTSSECPGDAPEVALDVTLSYLERVETIYVIADGVPEQVLRSPAGGVDVGTTRRVADESAGTADVDGGGGDVAIPVGDEETFRFDAANDGQTTLPGTYAVDRPTRSIDDLTGSSRPRAPDGFCRPAADGR